MLNGYINRVSTSSNAKVRLTKLMERTLHKNYLFPIIVSHAGTVRDV